MGCLEMGCPVVEGMSQSSVGNISKDASGKACQEDIGINRVILYLIRNAVCSGRCRIEEFLLKKLEYQLAYLYLKPELQVILITVKIGSYLVPFCDGIGDTGDKIPFRCGKDELFIDNDQPR